jgi:hypothetical protein
VLIGIYQRFRNTSYIDIYILKMEATQFYEKVKPTRYWTTQKNVTELRNLHSHNNEKDKSASGFIVCYV